MSYSDHNGNIYPLVITTADTTTTETEVVEELWRILSHS